MSTTVGNGLTVDGTVKASQATQAGEAVVLGDDGLIPANLVASGGEKVITEYTSISDFYNALTNGMIPIGSDVYIYLSNSNQKGVAFLRCTGDLPWPAFGGLLPIGSDYNQGLPQTLKEVSSTNLAFWYYKIDGTKLESLIVGTPSSSKTVKFSKAIIISEGS